MSLELNWSLWSVASLGGQREKDGRDSLTEPEPDHHCRSGDRCLARTSDGAAITSKPDTLCHACVARLQEQYDQLPAIRFELQGEKKRSLVPQGGGAKVRSSAEPGVAINLHVLDLIDEIDRVRAFIGASFIRDVITQPDGVRYALLVGRAWRKADGILGLSPVPWQRRFAPCPWCNLPTLGGFAGSGIIQCSNCGGTLTKDEYEQWCYMKAGRTG